MPTHAYTLNVYRASRRIARRFEARGPVSDVVAAALALVRWERARRVVIRRDDGTIVGAVDFAEPAATAPDDGGLFAATGPAGGRSDVGPASVLSREPGRASGPLGRRRRRRP